MHAIEKKMMGQWPLLNLKTQKKGEFMGWGSTDDIDQSGEKIWPAAFSDTIEHWKSLGQFPPILKEHDFLKGHIGICTALEVKKNGLYVHGQLFIDRIPLARQVYEDLLADETYSTYAMSVGFNSAKSYRKDGIRHITHLDLMEISLVKKPCNRKATVQDIKADHDPTDRSFIQPLEQLIARIKKTS